MNDKLNPLPENLIEKNISLAKVLNTYNLPISNKLAAIYSFLGEYKAFVEIHACCSKGCSYCCNMDIQLTTLEAEYIHVLKGVPMKHGKDITTGHTDPCPFLSSGGICNVYELRPITCRSLFAFGEPQNCANGKKALQIGVYDAASRNPIISDIITWVQAVVMSKGGEIRDIRDYFS